MGCNAYQLLSSSTELLGDYLKLLQCVLVEHAVVAAVVITKRVSSTRMWFACEQVVEDGYEFFAKRQLVTLFSAPNYCGEFDNAGAMMSVDETLMCSFQVTSVSVSCCRAVGLQLS